MVLIKGYTILPSIEGLARYLEVSRDTLYEWEKQYPEFSDILEAVRAEQADRLINNGLSGDYNPTITKLMLSKHGYSDKTDITTAGQPLNMDDETRALAKQAIHEYLNRKDTGAG